MTGRVLHFAPEESVAGFLKNRDVLYTSADIRRRDVDVNLNIERIGLADESYDVVVCSHVLEHVNDALALSELRRVLKPHGLLIVIVPIAEGCRETYEDPAITSPHDRVTHFGQGDHVRVYGADFVERLARAGFRAQSYSAFGSEAVRYGLVMGEKIFVCQTIGARHRDPAAYAHNSI